jgi:hypothetical protein
MSEEENESISIEILLARLQCDTEDLEQSLENFTEIRSSVIESQKRAFVEYELELLRIEEEYRDNEDDPFSRLVKVFAALVIFL